MELMDPKMDAGTPDALTPTMVPPLSTGKPPLPLPPTKVCVCACVCVTGAGMAVATGMAATADNVTLSDLVGDPARMPAELTPPQIIEIM